MVIGMEFELHELEFHAKKKISKFDRDVLLIFFLNEGKMLESPIFVGL